MPPLLFSALISFPQGWRGVLPASLQQGMSLYQGAAQIELWTGKKAPVEAMREELLAILAEKK